MAITLFKPNKSNTGTMGKFNISISNSENLGQNGELSLFVQLTKQASWNGNAGSFSENFKNPEKNISIKFGEFEIGAFINSLKRRVEYKGFHTFGGSNLSFFISPQKKPDSNETAGFYFNVVKGQMKFNLPITLGEAECLLALFDYALKVVYTNRTKNQAIAIASKKKHGQPKEEVKEELQQEEQTDDFSENQESELVNEESDSQNPFA